VTLAMALREATCADVPGIARVHAASWRTTYPGILPDALLDRLTPEAREPMWRRILCEAGSPTFVYVALGDDGEVVGFASGGPEATGDPVYTGELYAIYLLAEHQARGLGRSLLALVRGRLRALGHPSTLIWVAAANAPARGFYEAAGGVLLRERTVEFFGVPLAEVAYGWLGGD
jgi:ribosomal protein S18 acetylase RimI-like enzyme